MEAQTHDHANRKRAQQYYTQREYLCKQEFETSRDCDKYTLAAAGAALGLSFTFLKDVVPLGTSVARGCLVAGWFLLVLGVGGTLLALHFGHAAHRAFRECLDDAASQGMDEKFMERTRSLQRRCWEDKLAWAAGIAGLAATVLGTALLLLFVLINAFK